MRVRPINFFLLPKKGKTNKEKEEKEDLRERMWIEWGDVRRRIKEVSICYTIEGNTL